jgi:hypothetical protein
MRAVLYANEMNEIRKEFENKIQEELSGIDFQTLNSIQTLSAILRKPMNQVSVIVILICSNDEFTDFINLIPFFENIRVILVLPDREERTLALGLKLSPSFISYIDNGVGDICAVLRKIQKKSSGYQGHDHKRESNSNESLQNNLI